MSILVPLIPLRTAKIEHDFKMHTKRMQRILVYVSVVLDLAMLIEVGVAIKMVSTTSTAPCDELLTKTLVSVILFVTFIRVSHLIVMASFFVCCFPCYFCKDDCCAKKWLI